jgi:hypothetical protein
LLAAALRGQATAMGALRRSIRGSVSRRAI